MGDDHLPCAWSNHAKYLNLIRAITFLHQHQRPTRHVMHHGRRVEYIEATREDVELANKLAARVIPAGGELPPQTRKFFTGLKAQVMHMAKEKEVEPAQVKLTQRMIRQGFGMSATAVKKHLARLVDLEYLIANRGPNRTVFYGYDPDGSRFSPGGHGVVTPRPGPVKGGDSRGVAPVVSPDATSRHRDTPRSVP